MKQVTVDGPRGAVSRILRRRIFEADVALSLTAYIRFEIKAPMVAELEGQTTIPVTGLLFKRSKGR